MAVFAKGRMWLKFISTLTFLKIANSLALRVSYYLSITFRKQIIWGKPESVSIEPTNLCNLKCPECPSGNNSLNRPRLFLSGQIFYSLIDNQKKHLSYLQLYFQGEPFLHAKVYGFINYAVSRKIFVTTSTNGHFLSQSNCKKIVDSGLHQLIVSIDGTTQETFEKYRLGGSLEQVIKGIQNLNEAKKQEKVHWPHIAIQFVVFRQNEHQIHEIKDLAKKLGVSDVRLKSAQIDNFEDGSDLMPVTKRYNRYKKMSNGKYILKRNPGFKCFRVWSACVVSAEGDVLPCCFDKEAKYKYGNLTKGTLVALKNNENARRFIGDVWLDYRQFDICRNCTEGLGKTWF